MSLDLDWSLLDRSLSDRLVERLNRLLHNAAARPDFLGPISVLEFDSGDEVPEIELMGIHDIWPEFTAGDEEEDAEEEEEAAMVQSPSPVGIPRGGSLSPTAPRQASRAGGAWSPTPPSSIAASHHSGFPAGASVASAGLGHAGMFSHWGIGPGAAVGGKHHHPSRPASLSGALYAARPALAVTPASPLPPPNPSRTFPLPGSAPQHLPPTGPPTRQASFSSRAPFGHDAASLHQQHPLQAERELLSSVPPVDSSEPPSLQIKAHLRWQTTSLRLRLKTSLLINQPCYMFMQLPLEVTLTGLVLDGTLLLAVEGSKKRVHVSLLDEQKSLEEQQQQQQAAAAATPAAAGDKGSEAPNPGAGAGAGAGSNDNFNATYQSPTSKPRSRQASASGGPSPVILTAASTSTNGTGPNGAAAGANGLGGLRRASSTLNGSHALTSGSGSGSGGRSSGSSASESFGARLLPFLAFESSVGDEASHALRNVGKVEKFISELIRKVVEDELAFPNFYTLDLGS